MQVLFFTGSQLTFVDFVKDFAHLIQNQLNFPPIFLDFGNSSLLFGRELWTGSIVMEFFYFFKILLKIFSFLGLLPFDHFLLLSLLNALLVPLHNDGHKNVLDSCVEENHEENEVNLAWQTFSPSFKESIVDYVAIEEGEKSDY